MTAKHRGKGKNNHKNEENSFKHEALESEARGGGYHYTLLFILFLMVVIVGASAGWFCFQQHQTITYLADNLMGMQMKMVKLQSFQEEIRQLNNKPSPEGIEHRLNALEESYALAQKQVGMAMATAEQLKTSDLPAQVLSLHTEMKARLSEMQQVTVSMEQLGQLQSLLKEKSDEFQAVRVEVAGLTGVNEDLAQSVDALTGSLAAAESRLDERVKAVETLSSVMGGQASEVLLLKEQLSTHQDQLEASTLEIATIRDLLETLKSQWAQQAGVEEQLSTVRQSLKEQSSATQSLQSELRAQLETIHKQVAQLDGGTPVADSNQSSAEQVEKQSVPVEEMEKLQPEEPAGEEEMAHLDGNSIEQEDSQAGEQTAPAGEEVQEEGETAEEVAEEQTTPAEEEVKDVAEEQTAPADEEVAEEQTTPAEEEVKYVAEEQTAPADEEVQGEGETVQELQEEEVAKERTVPAEEEVLEEEEEEVAEEQTAPAEELTAPIDEEVFKEEPIGEENQFLEKEEVTSEEEDEFSEDYDNAPLEKWIIE